LNASGAMDLVGQPQAQVLHSLQPLGRGTTPLPIAYFMTLCEGYIQMAFFCDSQVGVPKLGHLLSYNFGHSYLFQIKFYFESCKGII
jgi:hypothetical protein